jgi:hypothetical protein
VEQYDLFAAIRQGDVSAIRQALEKNPEWLHKHDTMGYVSKKIYHK